jgi:hypothetical protein
MSVASRIISLSGRKHSGKSELAKEITRYGYKTIHFADNLKYLICHCLGITIEELNEKKDIVEEYPYTLTQDHCLYISKQTEIDLDVVQEKLSIPFYSIRKLLQIIGTDLIREYNPLWHINTLCKTIDAQPQQRFCIADTRFMNEFNTLQTRYNADCWYIIRPVNFDISNHESETNLQWPDFKHENILINNVSKEQLTKQFRDYILFGSRFIPSYKQDYMYFASPPLGSFEYTHDSFNTTVVIQGTYTSSNPYIIENLKRWNCFK